MEDYRIRTIGDSAVLLEFEQRIGPDINKRVTDMAKRLENLIEQRIIRGVTDWIPGFCSLMICYDPQVTTAEKTIDDVKLLEIEEILQKNEPPMRIVEIPVCYGRYFGPDLPYIAERAGMSCEEVIREHSTRDYCIYMLGFLPGFAYLGGLSERLWTPRLAEPRKKIPAGSVGIGGEQTGVYPLDSPGGWRLIGRTPVMLYDSEREESFFYRAGDYIRFVPIDVDEYYELRRQSIAHKWQPVVRLYNRGEEGKK